MTEWKTFIFLFTFSMTELAGICLLLHPPWHDFTVSTVVMHQYAKTRSWFGYAINTILILINNHK